MYYVVSYGREMIGCVETEFDVDNLVEQDSYHRRIQEGHVNSEKYRAVPVPRIQHPRWEDRPFWQRLIRIVSS